MASYCVIFCALLFLQGAWSSPATTDTKTANVKSSDETSKTETVTIGTQLSNNMNDNLLKVLENMRTGTIAISTPVVKFGVDTIPDLFTSGFKTTADAATKIVDAKKKGFRKLLNGVTSVAGGGAVLASSIAGGNMKVLGSGLGVAGNLIDVVAKFGLNITGNMADSSALANIIMANLTNSILNGAGKGMSLAGDGVNVLSKGSAKVIEAIGGSISNSISNAQDTMAKWFKSGSAKLQDGAMTLTSAAQVNYYNALQWYLHNLLAMEGIMDKLTETINSAGNKKSSSSEKAVSDSTNEKDKKE